MRLPTPRSLLSTSLLLLLSSTTTIAFPTAKLDCNSPSNYVRKQHEDTNCPLQPPPSLPQSSLPSTSLTLKQVLLGRGTQNYTCATSTSAPVAAGALATLYDMSCLAKKAKTLSQFATTTIPNLLGTASTQIESFIADEIPSAKVGMHFFRDATTPTFMLNDNTFIFAGKVGGCAAPSTATGNANGAAVDWVKLVRKPTEPSGGIEEVYRVETAGGGRRRRVRSQGW